MSIRRHETGDGPASALAGPSEWLRAKKIHSRSVEKITRALPRRRSLNCQGGSRPRG